MSMIWKSAAVICATLLIASCVTYSDDTDNSLMRDWNWHAPHGKLFINTTPEGALIEIYDGERGWLTIGSTPAIKPIMLEATGRTYLVKALKPGYFPEVIEVRLPAATRETYIDIPLREDKLSEAATWFKDTETPDLMRQNQ